MKRTLLATIGLLTLVTAACWCAEDSGQATVKPWSGYWWSMSRGELARGYDGRPAPLEKYDAATGDAEGKSTAWYLDHHYDPDAPGWHGYCHAWSAAAIVDTEPSATQYGQTQFRVGDNKGLLTACHFADPANFWGDRYGDGRGSEDKEDIAPCVLWQLLQTHIRDRKLPLVMDMNPGAEVWNHPIYAYRVEFGPGSGSRFNCRMTLVGADDNVRPDYSGTQEREWAYRFTVEMQDDRIQVGSGEWVGESRGSHPDFAWFPLQQQGVNPYLAYATVQQIAASTPIQPTAQPEQGTEPEPGTEPGTVAQPEPGKPPLPPGGEQLQTVQNATESLQAQIWVDRKDKTYAVGENVLILFQVNRDAYVTVLDLGTSGKLTRLFPNQFHKDSRVKANEIYTIPAEGDPFKYTVGEPVGTEMLKLIASTKPFEDPMGEQEQGQVFQPAKKGLKATVKDLNMVLDELPKDEWTDAWCVFSITNKK